MAKVRQDTPGALGSRVAAIGCDTSLRGARLGERVMSIRPVLRTRKNKKRGLTPHTGVSARRELSVSGDTEERRRPE